MRRFALAPAAFAVLVAIGGAGCDRGETATGDPREERMRAIERRIRESLPKTRERALTQIVEPALVRETEEALRALDEFQDPPDGVIDDVTVNAIQAFERRAGLEEDGLLDDRTVRELREAAAAARR
jgi:peptidoglycan hydrolase-like protein with peptidoglycan-binding domain